MKKLLLILSVLVLTACSEEVPIMKNAHISDQCQRAVIFQQCMQVLPAGPLATKYNDWDEVVSECGRQAFYQSIRNRQYIKPECQGE
jgi:hypothetical protein